VPGSVELLRGCQPRRPEPTTATRLPVREPGGWARTQPSSKARSMIDSSMSLMVTASL